MSYMILKIQKKNSFVHPTSVMRKHDFFVPDRTNIVPDRSNIFHRFPDHTNFAPDPPYHHFFASGSTSAWIFPHDWGRLYENLFFSNFPIRTNLHLKIFHFLPLFLRKKDIVFILTSSYGCYSKLNSVVSNQWVVRGGFEPVSYNMSTCFSTSKYSPKQAYHMYAQMA